MYVHLWVPVAPAKNLSPSSFPIFLTHGSKVSPSSNSMSKPLPQQFH